MNASNDDILVVTFFDSELWALIYGYTYLCVILTVAITSYHVASQIKLEHELYFLQNKIHKELEIISIVIHCFKKQHANVNNKQLPPENNKRKFQKITCDMVLNTIDIQFNKIEKTMIDHKKQLKRKIIQTNDNEKQLSNTQNAATINSPTAGDVESKLAEYMVNTIAIDDNVNVPPQSDRINENTPDETDKNGVIINTNLNINPIVLQYISKQLEKQSKKTKRGMRKFLSVMLDIRKIMFISFSHIFDTASDLAVAIEWYILYQKQKRDDTFLNNDEISINMQVMFWCCIIVIIYYRIASSYEVYKFTCSWNDTILQFIFDFYLIKLIYVNVMKMRSYKPLDFIKIMRSIEGIHESGFQTILITVFLIKTNFAEFNEYSNIIPILSLIFSLWSLISRLLFLDFYYILPKAQAIGVSLNDLEHSLCTLMQKINYWYIFHVLFRATDCICGILTISLIWVMFGGLVFILILVSYWCVVVLSQMCDYRCIVKNMKKEKILSTDFLSHMLVIGLINVSNVFRIDILTKYELTNCQCLKVLMYFVSDLQLLWFRLLLCCIFTFNGFDMHDNQQEWDTTHYIIVSNDVLFVIWLTMLVIMVKFYANRDPPSTTSVTRLNGMSHIASNNMESMLFCKELNLDIFSHPKYKQISSYTNVVYNVLEALLISNNIDNYDIVKEWYTNVINSKRDCVDMNKNLDEYLKSSLSWNFNILYKLAQRCDSLDYYILIQNRIGFDLSIVDEHNKHNILHVVCFNGKSSTIVEWILNNNIIGNINATNIYGNTCLHMLIAHILENKKMQKGNCYNEREIVHMLIANGIDQSIKNNDGFTAKQGMGSQGRLLYDWLISS